jgi:hypothetical protein
VANAFPLPSINPLQREILHSQRFVFSHVKRDKIKRTVWKPQALLFGALEHFPRDIL